MGWGKERAHTVPEVTRVNEDRGGGNGAVPWVPQTVHPFIHSVNVNGVPALPMLRARGFANSPSPTLSIT